MLSKKQKIGIGLGVGAAAVLAAVSGAFGNLFGSNQNSPNYNPGGGTAPPAPKPSPKPKITANQAIELAYQAKYLANVILKGQAYATMQKTLDLGIKEGTGQGFSNFANLQMLSSGSNVNVRTSAGTSGLVVRVVNKEDAIGKTTGFFTKRGGLVWAELTPFPALPIPYTTTQKVYVALAYMKTLSTINNLNGISILN